MGGSGKKESRVVKKEFHPPPTGTWSLRGDKFGGSKENTFERFQQPERPVFSSIQQAGDGGGFVRPGVEGPVTDRPRNGDDFIHFRRGGDWKVAFEFELLEDYNLPSGEARMNQRRKPEIVPKLDLSFINDGAIGERTRRLIELLGNEDIKNLLYGAPSDSTESSGRTSVKRRFPEGRMKYTNSELIRFERKRTIEDVEAPEEQKREKRRRTK